MMGLNYQSISDVYGKLNYPFYTSEFNVNIFGIRNPEKQVDEFNDILGIAYIDSFGRPMVIVSPGTTKPGIYYLNNKLGNVKGTFILKEGYYKSCWKRGLHTGKYDALVQSPKSTFEGWRDNDSDGKLDMSGALYKDVTGLNYHTTSFINDKEKVGAYSAGCQVDQDDLDYIPKRAIIYKSMEIYGDYVSYALFNLKDFF